MSTVTLIAPNSFTLNLDDGTSVAVKAGFNPGFPAGLVGHWYVKAMGATVAAEEAAAKPTDADPERDELAARAAAVDLKVDGRWSNDRLKQEVEAAEEAAAKLE